MKNSIKKATILLYVLLNTAFAYSSQNLTMSKSISACARPITFPDGIAATFSDSEMLGDSAMHTIFSYPGMKSHVSPNTHLDNHLYCIACDITKDQFCPCGIIKYHVCGAFVFIDCVGVVPSYQGKGLATLLLNLLEDKYNDSTYTDLLLVVHKHNVPAINCYKKYGFSID